MKEARSVQTILVLACLVAIPVVSIAVQGLVIEGNTGNQLEARQLATSGMEIVPGLEINNYSAPNFTWMAPITINISIASNTSFVFFIFIGGPGFDSVLLNESIAASDDNRVSASLEPLLFALPGDKNLTIEFRYNATVRPTITHTVWTGPNFLFTAGFIIAAIVCIVAIGLKYRVPTGPATGAIAPPVSAYAIQAPAGAGDDDSAVTYVDQSAAPPGRIFCPECKKVIEEGSIFCPECGTRIPRYLRYRPGN